MFNAVIGRKAGNAETEEALPEPVSEIFRTREDCRTATIFERLSYMPGLCAWNILRRACGKGELQEYRLAELEHIGFWPNWKISRFDRTYAQPDVYMRWSLGDPAQYVDLIIEAKLPWTSQSTDQWRSQLESYRDEILGYDGNSVHFTSDISPERVIYLIVDGHLPTGGFGTLGSDYTLGPQEFEDLPTVSFAACTWQSLAEALGDLEHEGRLTAVAPALLIDVRGALTYLGHAYFQMPTALLGMKSFADADLSLNTISKWKI